MQKGITVAIILSLVVLATMNYVFSRQLVYLEKKQEFRVDVSNNYELSSSEVIGDIRIIKAKDRSNSLTYTIFYSLDKQGIYVIPSWVPPATAGDER